MPPSESLDVLVVGAGQAGLGTAYWLTRSPGPRVLVVDRNPVGHSWVDRWDSLVLFTPRRFSALPGLAFPAGQTRCPTRLEMADYLKAYAERFDLPVRTGVEVRRITTAARGFEVETSDGALGARHVVLAGGPFARPHVPPVAAGLSPRVHQLHSSAYRSPQDVPAGDVLVVGGGNSAAQLAVELSSTHRVTVATPRPPWYLPTSVLGVDLYRWLWLSGVLDARADGRLARRVQRRGDPVVGQELRDLALAGRTTVVPHRVVGADGDEVLLADGTALPVTSVLWCTGYRPDTSFLDVPGALDADGAPVHTAGASPVAGLHWMGLPWQTRLSSSIVHGVDRDARAVAERAGVRARRRPRAGPGRVCDHGGDRATP